MTGHPIVHVEIPTVNAGAAGKFYSDVFGWQTQSHPEYNYTTFQAEGGPAGGFVQLNPESPIEYKLDSLLVYLATDDIDATLAVIEAHGGKTVYPKTEIPQVGWFAIFTDPSGNRLALFTAPPSE